MYETEALAICPIAPSVPVSVTHMELMCGDTYLFLVSTEEEVVDVNAGIACQ